MTVWEKCCIILIQFFHISERRNKMKNLRIVVAFVLCLATVFSFAACGGSGNGYKMTVVDKTLDEAKTAITDAGCTPVVISVYDEKNEDGAVLSFGELLSDAEKGDYVTIAVNDLSLKDQVLAQTLAPRIIPQDSYEKNIYNKISSDESLKSVFDSMYTLKTAEGASERQLESMYRTYPMTKDMNIYILDSGASPKELAEIAGMIADNTDYTAEDMFNDYIEVGLVPTPCEALKADVLSADNCEFTVSDDGVTVTLYTGTSQNIVVPAEIDEKTVVALAESAIPQSTLHALTTVDGLTTIAEEACSNAYGLIDLTISDTVMDIGLDAFDHALFTKTEGDFVTFNDEILLSYTGSDAEVTIPEGIEYIGAKAFEANKTITKINFPEGLVSIGNSAFKECKALSELVIPDGVLKICDSAFYEINHITTLNIPDSVIEIGNAAFYAWNDVTDFKIGEGVKKIGDEAFVYLHLITTLDIPESVEYVGNAAFQKCKLVTSVTGGEGLKFVGTGVFEEVEWFNSLKDEYSYLPNGMLIKYNNNKDNDITLPAEVTCISGAFYNNKTIKNVVINDGCTAITKDTFVETPALETVTIPASVTYIDPAAFDKSNMDIIIHCEAGSAAETFAKENFFKYDNEM